MNLDGEMYEGEYIGYAALQIKNKHIDKFAATDFRELKVNNVVLLSLDKPADILIERKNEKYLITIAGKNIQIIANKLSSL